MSVSRLLKWFYPGMRVKRWLGLAIGGVLFFGIGAALLPVEGSLAQRTLSLFFLAAGLVSAGVGVVLLVRSTAVNYARMTELITPYNKALSFPGLPSVWTMDSASGLMRLAVEIQHQAAMIGYINAFYLLAVTAGAGIPLVWLMRGAPRLR